MTNQDSKSNDFAIDLAPGQGMAGGPDVEKGRPQDMAPQLAQQSSHISHNELHTAVSLHVEVDAAQYKRFSTHKKIIICCVISLCGFLAPISSTTVLAAIPEVAAEYKTTGSIINISNALYLLFMGLSSTLWGVMGQIFGRRIVCMSSAALFFGFSIGTALAPNLPAFFVFRILSAIPSTALLIIGSSIIGDIYTPIERGTALGWFLSGALIGPAFGPFVGGIIVTFRTWRAIFWLQSAFAGLATVLVVLFLPETIPSRRIDEYQEFSRITMASKIAYQINPLRVVILLLEYPNLIIVGLASSALVWNMYSLLTPIRYVLNPRFHLTSPIQSGLFYIAPGCGYLVGSTLGGKWADHIVKIWIRKRRTRIPEDRLKSCISSIGFAIPACMLIYGWSVEKKAGGVPLPVIAMFIQGVGQLFCFPSLNTYCLDVMQSKGRSAEVVAGNYMIRYFFAAAGSAVCLPAIEKIGVGWFSTISSAFLVCATGLVWLTTRYGAKWRTKIEDKKRAKTIDEQSTTKSQKISNSRT